MMGAAGASGSAGSGQCDFAEPPADVAAWVDESWNAQLGGNIRGREAWLLDNVMLNEARSTSACVGARPRPYLTL